MNHPSFESLLNYAENALPTPEREQIERHLADDCKECARTIRRIRAVNALSHADPSRTPPGRILKKAFWLYQQREKETKPTLLQVVASLVFDSRQQVAPAMVRGTAAGKRVLLYSASPLDIDLQITPTHGSNSIHGQVMDSTHPDQFTSAFISIKNSQNGDLVRAAETDSLGQFHLQGIPPGTYELVLELNAQEVTVPSLEIL